MSLEDAAYDLQAIDSSKISKWKIIEHNLGASKECSQKTEVSVESFPNGMLSFCSNSYAFFNKQETLKESNDRDLHHFTSTTSTSCSHFCCLKSSPASTLPSPKGHRTNTGTKLRSMISCGLGSLGHSWNTVTYILSRSHSTNHPFKWRKLKGGCHKRCSYAFCEQTHLAALQSNIHAHPSYKDFFIFQRKIAGSETFC